ncbi:MAG TPA: MMPL family transporter [Gemmatimonadota bacterium]|nr:MMPL family transporter [Gemmatimonadota bacterium]
MQETLHRYFAWIVGHRYLVLAASLAVVIATAVGASRVPIDFTMEQFFPGWGPERERYDRYKQSFPKEDMQIAVFWKDARPMNVAVYSDLQTAAGYFAEAGLQDVRWLGNVDVADIGDGSAVRVHRLIEEDSVDDAYLNEVLARHRDHNLFRGFLWNAEQTVFAVHGSLSTVDMGDDQRRREIDETLQARLDALAVEGTEFALSGIPITRSRIPKLLDEDQRRFVGAGIVVFLLILFLFFRHAGQVVLCLVSIVPAYLVTVSAIGLMGKTVTVLTGFIPIIVLVVGGSDIIHLLTSYRQSRAAGVGNDEAIVESFTELAVPCFYTSLTTAIGFVSLAGTRIGIVIDFGIFTALAILATYAFSMTLLPVLLSLYRRERFGDGGLQAGWIRALVQAATALAVRPSSTALAGFVVVAVAGLGLALTLQVDSYLIDDLKKSAAVRRDLIWIEESGFGIYQVVIHMQQSGDRPLHHPDALRWMQELQRYVANDPVVVGTFGLPDLLERLPRGTADGRWAIGQLPAGPREADQMVATGALYDPGLFKDVYRLEGGEAQLVITVKDAGSRLMLPFLHKVDSYIGNNPLPAGGAVSTGTVKLIQNYSARVLQNFAPSLALAILLIFLVLSLMFRSFKHGLMALIPNFFPLLVLLAAMKLAGFALKPSTILVCSIAFGLAVDDSIHLLGRFRRAVWQGLDVGEAVQRAVREAGPAIIMTTTVVCAGFSLLMGSRFEVLFLVGLMTVISALAALAADLFALPTFLGLALWRSAVEGTERRLSREPLGPDIPVCR